MQQAQEQHSTERKPRFFFYFPSHFWYVGCVGAGKEGPILHFLQTNLSTNVVDGRSGKRRVYKATYDLGGPFQ